MLFVGMHPDECFCDECLDTALCYRVNGSLYIPLHIYGVLVY